MGRLCMTVDDEMERQIRAEVRRRRVTLSRWLREASARELGRADGMRVADEQSGRIARLEARVVELEQRG